MGNHGDLGRGHGDGAGKRGEGAAGVHDHPVAPRGQRAVQGPAGAAQRGRVPGDLVHGHDHWNPSISSVSGCRADEPQPGEQRPGPGAERGHRELDVHDVR